jgi:zinc/manganese transport system permease protein
MLAFTILAGAGIGIFCKELREEDVNIGIVMTLALGLGALFIALYNGYAEQAYSILFGTILGISRTDVLVTLIFGIGTLIILAAIFRPLLFSSIDPEVAEARGVPTKALSIIFMFLLAITVAEAIQVVGVLLVFALIVAPAAAAQHLTRKPFSAIAIAIALGIVFTWGGLLLALATSWPVSFYIASLSALTYFAAIRIGHFVHPHARAHENHPGREIKTV